MIKFFRIIRQNLLSEGKAGKYLKYAVGEIILVVIGILIALSLNNQNEIRKNKQEEKIILNDIKKELIENKKLAIKTLEDYNGIVRRSRKVSSAMDNKNYDINTHTLDTLMEAFIFPPRYNPYNNVINSVTLSGKLYLIENKNITYKLNAIAGLTEDYKYWSEIDNNNVVNLNIPFILDKYPVKSLSRDVLKESPSNFNRDVKLLFGNVKLESLFELRRVNAMVIIENLNNISTEQEELILLIDKELKK